MKKAHLGYPLSGQCLTCHSPHSSISKYLAREFLHEPFADKDCEVCHVSPKLGGQIKIYDEHLCLGCHAELEESSKHVYTHLLQAKHKVICLTCHTPHASDSASLISANERMICFSCHTDTKYRMTSDDSMFAYKHPQVAKCSTCHVGLHGSDFRLFLADTENVACSKCHVHESTATHPMGKDAIDPRSKRGMTCISCHNPMGAPEKLNLRYGRKMELCVQCHKM